jgi:UDP-3-O-[3-hydroxymyristoyl] glucosamine N-acyltransferase
MKLSHLIESLNVTAPDGQDLDIEIEGLNTLKDGKEGELSFLHNENYISQLKDTRVTAILIHKKYLSEVPDSVIPLVSDNPYIELAKASKLFSTPFEDKSRGDASIGENTDIDSSVHIGNGAVIGKNVRIFANSYIGDNVEIGDNTVIYPNVTLYKDTIIGKDVIIHSGTVIGSDGYGFATDSTGKHIKIYQNGYVEIGDSVEIGANCTVDRAVFERTVIRTGTKIDNLVHIGHNSDIGEHSLLVGQSGISGSTTVGRNFVLGGQSGVAGHLKIAPFTTVTARAGVTKSIRESGKYWSGFPLFEHRKWLKLQAKISSLLK